MRLFILLIGMLAVATGQLAASFYLWKYGPVDPIPVPWILAILLYGSLFWWSGSLVRDTTKRWIATITVALVASVISLFATLTICANTLGA
jgi:hypothetical protein